MRKIIHVDMDAFYASVEQLDDPSLRGKPVAVGGSRARGVIMAASYEARKYGLRSAMPSSKAYRLCPQVVFVPPRFARYKELSGQIRQIFLSWTPLVEPLSLDEAYLDITDNNFNEPSARKAATEIKHQIKAETGLTASAGVSYNKFLAKIASDYQKPDGLFVIPPSKAEAFIEELPIEKFFGIGRVTAEKMKAMGISTGADLKRLSEVELAGSFGKSGRYYYRIVRGLDERAVDPNRARKSISVETTFENDLNSLEALRPVLEKLNEELWRRMERSELLGRTLTIKVKYTDFSLCTRSQTTDHFISGAESTIRIAEELLKEVPGLEKGIRLIGLGFSKLNNEQEDTDGQLSLEL